MFRIYNSVGVKKMNALEQHDFMIRKSERIILLKTILKTMESLHSVEEIIFYLQSKFKDENSGDLKLKK